MSGEQMRSEEAASIDLIEVFSPKRRTWRWAAVDLDEMKPDGRITSSCTGCCEKSPG